LIERLSLSCIDITSTFYEVCRLSSRDVIIFHLVVPFLLSRIRRNSTADFFQDSSDLENAGRSDTDRAEIRPGEFGSVYAVEPDEQALASSSPDNLIDEIPREVDESRHSQPDGNDANDGESESSGEGTDLGDVTPSRISQRRPSLGRRFSTSSLTLTPTRWQKFKNFIFPPTPDFDELIPQYRIAPIISGMAVPFALLLEIGGLTESWYIRVEGNNVVETRPNSAILDVGLAVSIFNLSLVNIFLVLRFLEIRVKTMTIFSVVFLTTHGELHSVSSV
jgi:hypothetical protein